MSCMRLILIVVELTLNMSGWLSESTEIAFSTNMTVLHLQEKIAWKRVIFIKYPRDLRTLFDHARLTCLHYSYILFQAGNWAAKESGSAKLNESLFVYVVFSRQELTSSFAFSHISCLLLTEIMMWKRSTRSCPAINEESKVNHTKSIQFGHKSWLAVKNKNSFANILSIHLFLCAIMFPFE